MSCRLVSLALALAVGLAEPAFALGDSPRRWLPQRHPGSPLADRIDAPSGWRLGPAITSPFGYGLSLATVTPGDPAALKLGLDWNLMGSAGPVAFSLSDLRAFAALVYYMQRGVGGGPYIEAGLGHVRSTGALSNWGWPVVPHLGFGVSGWLGQDQGWDLNFSGTANGLLTLSGGLLY